MEDKLRGDRRRKTEKREKRREKKSENRWKYRFLREILKNGVCGDSEKGDFIGLICFWGKNGGKNEQKFAFFCKN
jgi:hypothetical protein